MKQLFKLKKKQIFVIKNPKLIVLFQFIVILLMLSLPLKLLCKLLNAPFWCFLVLGGLISYILKKVYKTLIGENNESSLREFLSIFILSTSLLYITSTLSYFIIGYVIAISYGFSITFKILSSIFDSLEIDYHYIENNEEMQNNIPKILGPVNTYSDTINSMTGRRDSNESGEKFDIKIKKEDSPTTSLPNNVFIKEESMEVETKNKVAIPYSIDPCIISKAYTPEPFIPNESDMQPTDAGLGIHHENSVRIFPWLPLIDVKTREVSSFWPEHIRYKSYENYLKGVPTVSRDKIPMQSQSTYQIQNILLDTSRKLELNKEDIISKALHIEARAEYKRRVYLDNLKDKSTFSITTRDYLDMCYIDRQWQSWYDRLTHPRTYRRVMWDNYNPNITTKHCQPVFPLQVEIDKRAHYYFYLEEVQKRKFINDYIFYFKDSCITNTTYIEAEKAWDKNKKSILSHNFIEESKRVKG
jgi:hypothetical protein